MTGFYMMATLAFNELKISSVNMIKSARKCGFGLIKNIKELSYLSNLLGHIKDHIY